MLLIDLKIALKALKATRVRTALTMLGIVIGVASVTVVMALGEGAKEKIRSEVQQLGTDLITVRPGKLNRDEHGAITNINILSTLSSSTLTEQDFDTVAALPNIRAAAPVMSITGSVTDANDKEAQNASIIATTNEAPTALGITIRNGEFLSDLTNRETVVLGQELAVELLGADNAVGHKIKLRGQEFTVVGILQPFNTGTLGNISTLYNYNRTAFIPLDAGKAFNHGLAQIQQINARGNTDTDNKLLSNTIHQQILANHGGEEDFSVLLPEETLQVTDSLVRIVTLFTTAIASISLIVGGVGIMNIMLVSVTERTREIGVRKAIGATNAQIMRQFLIEALLMSTVGGIIGAIAAYAIAFGIGTFVGFMPVITWQIVALAAGVSIVTGVLFGIAPAYKASRKDPIEALRNFQ